MSIIMAQDVLALFNCMLIAQAECKAGGIDAHTYINTW